MTVVLTGTWVGRGSYMEIEEIEPRVNAAWKKAKSIGGPIYPYIDEDFGFFVDDGAPKVVNIDAVYEGSSIVVSLDEEEGNRDPRHDRESSNMERPLDPEGDPVKHWWSHYGHQGIFSLKDEFTPTEEEDPAFHHYVRKFGLPTE